MFHWSLTFLTVCKKSCWPWYHNQGLERCVSPCTLADGKLMEVIYPLHLGPIWSLVFRSTPQLQWTWGQILMLEKLWAAKIKIEENFLELSFILILLLFIKIPLLCFFKKLWKNLSLGLQVGWMLLVFSARKFHWGHSRETAPFVYLPSTQ